MKKKHIALKNFAVVTLLISSFIACDKDFASLDSDIINNDNAIHFITESMKFDVVTYNKKLDPVQTNNLPVNYLGVYNDPVYGTNTASVVTQIITEAIDRQFGENLVMDSVVLTIPYFSRAVEVKDDGETIYELDSVFGKDEYQERQNQEREEDESYFLLFCYLPNARPPSTGRDTPVKKSP